MDHREPALFASPGSIHGSRQPHNCAHRRILAVGFPYMDRVPGKDTKGGPEVHHLKRPYHGVTQRNFNRA